MRYLFLIVLFIATPCFADVTAIYKNDTGEVYYFGENPEKFNPNIKSEFSSIELKGNLKDYPLEYPINYYKVSGNRLVVNTSKISEETNREQESQERMNEFKLIENKLIDIAIDALKQDGIILKHYKKSQ